MSEKVRFGGEHIDGRFNFELSGGNLSLDFVNTLDERAGDPEELLTSFSRLLQWSRQSSAITEENYESLVAAEERNPRRSEEALRKALELRETLFRSIDAIIRNGELPPSNLKALEKWKRAADLKKSFRFERNRLEFNYEDSDPTSTFWPVVDSAFDLFSSERACSRLKLCAGETCDWAFLDQSRQGNRRWCDMSVCGNRAKAKRFRGRH